MLSACPCWASKLLGLRQYAAAIAACLGIIASGSCFAWITPIFNHLLGPDSEIPMTAGQAPWIVSIIEVGNLVIALPAGILVNYLGRKPVILVTGPLFVVSWLIIIYFPSAFGLGVARVIQGFAIGLVYTAVPVYLGEIASNSSRGTITSILFLSWWIGLLVSYTVGPFLSYQNFIYFTLSLNFPFIFFFSFQPESPYYLVMSGKEEEAREVLRWLRDVSSPDLERELTEITHDVTSSVEKTTVGDLVTAPEDRRALALLIVLTSVRVLSGNGAISVYATDIFRQTPNLSVCPDTVTIAVGVVMLLGGCVATFTTDTLGRRPLLLVSCVGCTICQFCTATYYLLLFETPLYVNTFSWVSPVFILLYSGLCTAGMYPVSSAYTSELFNTQTRGIASCFSVITLTVCSIITILAYQPNSYGFNLYANFYFFALYTFFATVYIYFTAPETKGKSFAQIRENILNVH